MKIAAVLVLLELVAIYSYLAGFDAAQRPTDEMFRGD